MTTAPRRETRERLSYQKSEAEFDGMVEGKESMLLIYPPRANRMYASFRVTRVVEYAKPGKYGDAEVGVGQIQKFAMEEQTNFAELLRSLAPGDKVRISWEHNYVTQVTTKEDGKTFTAKSPERKITELTRA